MANCSFCKSKLAPGTGVMFVKRDGSSLYFCSSKCEKNMMKLGRTGRTTLWVTREKKKGKKASKRPLSANIKEKR